MKEFNYDGNENIEVIATVKDCKTVKINGVERPELMNGDHAIITVKTGDIIENVTEIRSC